MKIDQDTAFEEIYGIPQKGNNQIKGEWQNHYSIRHSRGIRMFKSPRNVRVAYMDIKMNARKVNYYPKKNKQMRAWKYEGKLATVTMDSQGQSYVQVRSWHWSNENFHIGKRRNLPIYLKKKRRIGNTHEIDVHDYKKLANLIVSEIQGYNRKKGQQNGAIKFLSKWLWYV